MTNSSKRPHLFRSPHGDTEYYAPVLLTPQMVLREARSRAALEQTLALTRRLEPDGYTQLLQDFYQAGLDAYGDTWGYTDLISVLHQVARLTQPRNYLEIGVRRGRSVAAVVSAAPHVVVHAFDLWTQNYGHNPNPGPEFVQAEMAKFGYTTPIEFVSGNSHDTLPAFFANHPDLEFDLITVDGDHSYQGALADLNDVLPRLAIGGVVIFDDISHPRLPHLLEAWNVAVSQDRGLRSAHYTDLGYGVAVGIRNWERGAPKVLSLEQAMQRNRRAQPLKAAAGDA